MSKPIYLYVTDVFPGEGNWRGGYCYDAVKAMMRDGRYDVRVIRMQSVGGSPYEIDGIQVWPCVLPNVGYFFYFPYFVNRKLERSFLDCLRGMGVDVSAVAVCHVNLIQHFEYVGTAVKRANPKTFVMYHYHFSGCTSFKIGHFGNLPFVSELYYLYRRHQVRKMDACVYCSETSRSLAHEYYPRGLIDGEGRDMRKGMWFAALLPRTTPRRTVVCYNGIDRRVFNDQGRDRSKDGGVYRIGCIANFSEQKGQMTLIQAFERVRSGMPDSRLEFVGSGADLVRCKSYVESHGLSDRVTFHTEVDHTQLPEFYWTLDLFVLPTCREAFCCVLSEALTCGVPIISTGCGTFLPEAFSRVDLAKWLVRPRDPEDVAEKLLRAYAERPTAQKLMKDLDIDVVIPQFLDWIDANKM